MDHLTCEPGIHTSEQLFWPSTRSVPHIWNFDQLSLPWPDQGRVWHLQNRSALFEFIERTLADAPIEHLLAAYLDPNLRLLEITSVGCGGPSSVDFRLSEVLREGIKIEAAAFILIHNHPSGIAKPSSADITVTRRICSISSDLDMPLLDHLIVTKQGIRSVGVW